MISTQRSPTRRMLAGAATTTVVLGLLGAGAPAALAADHSQDRWWYDNHLNWQGTDTWHDNGDGWRYRNSRTGYSSYRYDAGRPYYYSPPPTYYYLPAHVDRPTLSVGYTF